MLALSIVYASGCSQKNTRGLTLSTAMAIESAVINFLTEYGSMPHRGTTDTTILTNTDTDLLPILLGMENHMNKRSIKLINVKEAKENRNGLVYSKDGRRVVGLFDEWGSAYNVRMDLNFDHKIAVRGKILNDRRVAVWSNGPDRQSGTKDDVETW